MIAPSKNKPLMQRLLLILSSSVFSWFTILFAMGARAVQLLYFFNIRSDASFQFLATKNLIDGHGLTISRVSTTDLSSADYMHVVQWPPGFSVIAAPFYVLFNNYIITGLVLQFLAAVLLIFTTRRILKLLELPAATINFFTILTSVYIYPFYFLCCSDAIAISFFFLAFLHALLAMKKGTATISNYIWLCVGLFTAAFIKYLFIPVVFVVPAFLYLKGRADDRKKIIHLAVICFRVIAFALAITLFYQKFTGGAATYISEPARGLYLSNLSTFYPCFPSSIIQVSTLILLQSLTSENTIWDIYRLIQIIILVSILFLFTRKLVQHGFRNLSFNTGFIYLAFFIALTITLLLASLSLIVAKENINYAPWTYVEEPRYYGVIMVLVHLVLFWSLHSLQTPWFKKLFLGLMILLSVEGLRGFVFTTKRIIQINKEEYSWQRELRFQRYADEIIQAQKAKYQAQDAVVAGSSYYMNHRIALYSHIPVLYDASGLNELARVASGKPAILFVALHRDKLHQFSTFLNEATVQVAGQFDEFYFYVVYVSTN